MKPYHVYSVGAAFIDYEFKPTQEECQHFIGESETNLLSTDQEKALLSQLSSIKHIRACGGSGGNTVSMISQLGGHAYYSCKVGCDEAGDFYYESLRLLNIDTNLDQGNRSANSTGKCIIILTPESERIMHSFLGANTDLSIHDLNESAIARSQYVFIESLLAINPFTTTTVLKAKEMAHQYGCKIALTLSTCVPPHFTRDHLHTMIGTGVDLLFCNLSEAAFFCGTHDIQFIKEKLRSIAKQFVITLGKKGALLFDGTQFHELPAYSTQAVDTTGAGDAFAGALLYALTHGADFPTAGDFANYAAAKLVSQYGARLHDAKVIQEIRKKIRQTNLNLISA